MARPNPYRNVVLLRQPDPVAGEVAPQMFPIYDAYTRIVDGGAGKAEKDAFVRTLGRNMRIETQKLLDEMFAAVPDQNVERLYAWGKANNRDIDRITPANIATFQDMERRGADARTENDIFRGWVDHVRAGAQIPLDMILPSDAGGAAGEPATGGRRRKTRRHRKMTRKHKKTVRRR